MLVSLNWIRDFVDLPDDLDPNELAERFTLTTAEVDAVRPVRVDADGLIVARVRAVEDIPGTRNLRLVRLDVGRGETIQTVTAAPIVHPDHNVVFAPPGTGVRGYEKLGTTEVSGHASTGMILPAEALGIPMAAQEAVFVSNAMAPGQAIAPELFEDWVIEIDNKSVTHRPDLWGHYGIAREIAAMYGLPLKPYPVSPLDELTSRDVPEIPIELADPVACPRYTALRLEGVPTQPAPLWIQLRLGHVGLRPITGLVDLTNYIMLDLGQPMHAFDGDKVQRIEVDFAADGELFRTLDGVERKLTAEDLMIKSSGHSIALAGVMGGLETEVSETTQTLLLESANFAPATIRRTAIRLGLRTDTSARFEKSLDPNHTVLGVQRFVALAREMYPSMRLAGRLSDAYPKPAEPLDVEVNPRHITRMIGRKLANREIGELLTPLGFQLAGGPNRLHVRVPTFRATGDVSIEADIIEEIARCIGYNTIEPALPEVTVRRFEPNALHELEQRTLEYFTTAARFHEIHGYLWYDDRWMAQLGADPGACVELTNPPAEGQDRLRRSLIPGLLAALVRNRHHFADLSLLELGSVFEPADPQDQEYRHVALIRAQRGKRIEDDLLAEVKGVIEGWAWERFTRTVRFAEIKLASDQPWAHPDRTAEVHIDGRATGCVSVIDTALRRTIDEHLVAWGVAWAELRLTGLEDFGRGLEKLDVIPEHPVVDLDFSIVVSAATRYAEVADRLRRFDHPLLRRLHFITSYEGESLGPGKRSLTFRTYIGHEERTLVDEEVAAFRAAFEDFLAKNDYEIRR